MLTAIRRFSDQELIESISVIPNIQSFRYSQAPEYVFDAEKYLLPFVAIAPKLRSLTTNPVGLISLCATGSDYQGLLHLSTYFGSMSQTYMASLGNFQMLRSLVINTYSIIHAPAMVNWNLPNMEALAWNDRQLIQWQTISTLASISHLEK
jgi:hypothetical protein